jgi:two-component system sensor histidine kinase RegB
MAKQRRARARPPRVKMSQAASKLRAYSPRMLPRSLTDQRSSTPERTAEPAELAEDTHHILTRWLIGLRWAVFLFLAATLPLDDWLFGFHVRYAIAVPVLALMIAWNAWSYRRLATGAAVSTRGLGLGVAVDLVAIGAVLAASGGAANPFSAVFFVHVALAASLLPARTTFALAGLSALLFASLFALPSGACCPAHPANGAFSTHLYGMLLAFVVSAGLVAYFLTRVRGALDMREQEITRLRRQAEENTRFAALGTLAAGTAHELCTPLGTIAVLAGELAEGSADAETRAHGSSIAAQVGRCRDILTKMQAGAASPIDAEGLTVIGSAVRRGIEAWRRAHPDAPVELREMEGSEARVALSSEDVEAAICALLDNALHATREAHSDEAIEVSIAREEGAVKVVVEDAGAGVAPELQGRLGEPFLTTKEPGEGMGLGLYLIRTLLRRVGGRLDVARRDPQGTKIILHLAEGRA